MTDIRIGLPQRSDVLAVGWDARGPLLDQIPQRVLPSATRGAVAALVAELAATNKGAPRGVGALAAAPQELARPGERPSRVLVAALGDGSPARLRQLGIQLARASAARALTVALPPVAATADLVEGLLLGDYSFRIGTRPPQRTIWLRDASAAEVARGLVFGRSVRWARDLANTRASTKTPAWLAAAAARELVPLGVDVRVHDETWLRAGGFGGVLAVGAGAAAPPRLIEARWSPRGATTHLVLVGKGITFDTGGLNLKPGNSMSAMFTDMAGGAAALGAMRTVASLRLPVRVTVLVPAAENCVSGSAMRPGDVIRHYGGRTSEVRNTDAEGRLVLADALGYAASRLRPSAIVDVATLTGAMKVALGLRTAGLFTASDEHADALCAAGARAGEPLWRMPLVEDYLPQLDSQLADAQNSPGNPGGITAALFLRPFAGGVPWAHLDIAGPARAAPDSGVPAGGATGFGTGLLARWMESAC